MESYVNKYGSTKRNRCFANRDECSINWNSTLRFGNFVEAWLVRLVSPLNGELSFIMAAILWSDRFINEKLQKFKHRRKTFSVSFVTNK